ncbi:MAG: ZIP family zinc transporter [Bryobacteraceae bacterium]|nr:ZIP family zinc transporter [Bryobacteraceae bacterium]
MIGCPPIFPRSTILLLGAAVSYFVELPHRVISAVVGFGGGVLIAVLSFDLIEEAYKHGGFGSTIAACFAGAALFCAANWYISQHGGKHRKRCGDCVQQPTEVEQKGSGLAIAVGALIDEIPEAIIIGISLVGGGSIGFPVIVGFFLANIPQGLSGTAGMKQANRSARYIFGLLTSIVLMSGLAAAVGYGVFGYFSPGVIGGVGAFAAGGMLAMLAETMIPEAFEDAQSFIGLITVAGFLCAFALHKLSAPA